MAWRGTIAGIALLAALPSLAGAEDTICTPEYYFNPTEQPPLVIEIDAARARGSLVTRVDLETGAYRELRGGDEAQQTSAGAFIIVDEGSLQERVDFVAIEPDSGAVLRISLIDDGLPFVRIDAEGVVASGHCIHEYDQP